MVLMKMTHTLHKSIHNDKKSQVPENKFIFGNKNIFYYFIVRIIIILTISQGLGTTIFTNLVGWNRYWKQSRFSHLDQHLDRLTGNVLQWKSCKLKGKIMYIYEVPKSLMWKMWRGWANFGRIKLARCHSQAKCQWVQTSHIKQNYCSCFPYNKHLINQA